MQLLAYVRDKGECDLKATINSYITHLQNTCAISSYVCIVKYTHKNELA